MKNCLIVFGVLIGCFVVAAILFVGISTNWGRGFAGGAALMVGQWRNYDDPKMQGMTVSITPDLIVVDLVQNNAIKRYMQKGTWRSHAFYADSHKDSPSEVQIANELRTEDLEVNLSYFSPSLPERVTCVLLMRRMNKDGYFPYPTYMFSGMKNVTYPPPKGLIRPGMLECDLKTLPWRADHIEYAPIVVHVYDNQGNDDDHDESLTYTYHSDRPDAPQLLVKVLHGRVIQVIGGAEETGDIPYTAPAQPPSSEPDNSSSDNSSSWTIWLFNLIFSK